MKQKATNLGFRFNMSILLLIFFLLEVEYSLTTVCCIVKVGNGLRDGIVMESFGS